MAVINPFDYRRSEVVFGVVAAVGTDTSQLGLVLREHLKRFNYQVDEIKLSAYLQLPQVRRKHKVRLRSGGEAERINLLMTAGNRLREATEQKDVLALWAASDVGARRPPRDEASVPVVRVLYTLKRPEEVETLRQVYGPGFFLIGVYASEESRILYLEKKKDLSRQQAVGLVKRDQEEADDWGQRTRGTFTLADVFVELDGGLDQFQAEVERFVDLVFGSPTATPTPAENAMFLAHAASLRSADLSRQVGAVVVSQDGEVIGTGANDVPRFGGGLYWPGIDDRRDHTKGSDSNKVEIERIAAGIVGELFPKTRGTEREARIRQVVAHTRLNDLTEFGRPVHAEMEALLQCARSGVSPAGGSMYTTTFPCHNCAKHIVAAGITKVFFVEPYPKSKALELHDDAICVEEEAKDKVSFLPFVGVGARRYFDLFSMRISSGREMKRKAGSDAIKFDRGTASPRVAMLPTSFLERERLAGAVIRAKME
jgi:deoxycytidylate deaminase